MQMLSAQQQHSLGSLGSGKIEVSHNSGREPLRWTFVSLVEQPNSRQCFIMVGLWSTTFVALVFWFFPVEALRQWSERRSLALGTSREAIKLF